MTTSNTPKLTKFQKFEMLSKLDAVQTNEVLAEFVAHEMELLANKKSAPKKPTATQKANASIVEAIVAGMEHGRAYTITEIIKEIPECAELTNQRVSAIIRPLVVNGTIIRTEDKRKAYFSLAE
jgi:predicted transcriptional regulator